ncbi:hypothetical protein HMPREF9061_01531 [Actinomyces sp. oral taxon 181 str. F0379]|nr:hypothetical protein HMPREF9061_01531 [Actinomyces sp. oral taxon 181 str. F0379]
MWKSLAAKITVFLVEATKSFYIGKRTDQPTFTAEMRINGAVEDEAYFCWK